MRSAPVRAADPHFRNLLVLLAACTLMLLAVAEVASLSRSPECPPDTGEIVADLRYLAHDLQEVGDVERADRMRAAARGIEAQACTR